MQYIDALIDAGGGPRRFRSYLPDATERSYYRGKRPAVIILPGGGYGFTFEGEAEPIALAFLAAGIPAFVLDYSTTSNAERVYPYALLEAFEAVRSVRLQAENHGIDPDNIAILGFSAGGHLAASVGTLWNKPLTGGFSPRPDRSCRPDKMILCYPVIRAFPPCHEGSFVNLFGGEDALTDEVRETFSLQNQVDEFTPPSFLWTTSEDTGVPIQGALEFAHALADHGVHTEMHLYPHGGHGSCLGNHVTEALPFREPMTSSGWVRDAVRFLFDENLSEPVK